jgi:inorganic pyrophosphatase
MDGIFAHVRLEIEHFFTIYKELEGRKTATLGWGGPGDARKAIREGRKKYLEQAAGRGRSGGRK